MKGKEYSEAQYFVTGVQLDKFGELNENFIISR